MAETITLTVQSRKRQKKECRDLRKEGLIPGVVYGHGKEPVSVEVPYLIFDKVYQSAGENTIIDLKVGEGATEKVLIYEADLNPVTDNYHHIDFYRVDMNKPIDTEIPLKFVGQSPCVTGEGGIFIQSLDDVEVRCLPGDLISEIEVDITGLEKFNDSIHISDLKVPDTIKLMQSDSILVAQVIEPKEEEIPVEAPEGMETAVEGEEPKAEGEAPAEGEKKEEGGDKAAEGETKEEEKKKE